MKKVVVGLIVLAVLAGGAYLGMHLVRTHATPAQAAAFKSPSPPQPAGSPGAAPAGATTPAGAAEPAASPAGTNPAPAGGAPAGGSPLGGLSASMAGGGVAPPAAAPGAPPQGANPAGAAPPSSPPAGAAGSAAPAGAAPAAPGASPAPSVPPPSIAAPGPPATTTSEDLAAEAEGGTIETVTGMVGPGFTGRRLIDGKPKPTWQVTGPVTYPQDVVFSFYDRQPALVSAVAIQLPDDASLAPKDVEVWASMNDGPTPASFIRVTGQTLDPRPGIQTVSFPAVNARFVKLRVLSGTSPKGLEVAEVQVLEAAREGYVPLVTREPDAKSWYGSPREAGQVALDWLEQAATDWPKLHQCFGCHVQAQVIMGQAIALRHDYRVNMDTLRYLVASTRQYQETDGTVPGDKRLGAGDSSWFSASTSATVFGVLGLAYGDEATGATTDPDLLKGLDFLLKHQQADGAIPVDRPEPPLLQGDFMTTANTLVALDWAKAHSNDPKYQLAASHAVAWIAAGQPESTQDKVFKILALTRDGSPDQKKLVWPVVEQLASEQQKDGGWKERAQQDGSNALATGQVLYAFKQAGVSVQSGAFRRGVAYLLKTQVDDGSVDDGSWREVNSQSGRQSPFAHTMWAVIGLAGSYGISKTGSLEIVTHPPGDKPPSRNLEVVLDASGSMSSALGTSTRWKTALAVLKQLLDGLPDDFNVGLRVYGHRYPPSSRQSCSDSQLVVPITKLDRAHILSTASALRPRGETPLVSSVLQTVNDLHAVGSGSVILITDGEESCHGDAKAAAAKLKTSGVSVTLNIVGFTLTGKAVAAQLSALAGATGGRYYSATDGQQLSRALALAAMQRIPYEVLDASGQTVISGQASDLGQELPPGDYRVRIHIMDQDLEAPVTITANQTTTLMIGLQGDKFVIQR
jgi:von Willebrand factor type A domain